MTQRLTPVDILNLRFRRRLRGYAVAEVDDFVRRVAADLEAALAEGARKRERVEALERELAGYRTLEATMRDALVLAQQAADEARAAARAQAQAHLAEARTQVAAAETRVETLRQERRRLARDLRAQLTAHLAWLDEEMREDTDGALPVAPEPRAALRLHDVTAPDTLSLDAPSLDAGDAPTLTLPGIFPGSEEHDTLREPPPVTLNSEDA